MTYWLLVWANSVREEFNFDDRIEAGWELSVIWPQFLARYNKGN